MNLLGISYLTLCLFSVEKVTYVKTKKIASFFAIRTIIREKSEISEYGLVLIIRGDKFLPFGQNNLFVQIRGRIKLEE